jgi:hypothetical protein
MKKERGQFIHGFSTESIEKKRETENPKGAKNMNLERLK